MLRYQYVGTRQLLKAQLKWHTGRNFLKTLYRTTMKVVNTDKHLTEKFRGSPNQKKKSSDISSVNKNNLIKLWKFSFHILRKEFFVSSNKCELCKEYGHILGHPHSIHYVYWNGCPWLQNIMRDKTCLW